jgi:hypothetical protein
MEPSWTFPIPLAMQQHRGSQGHKSEPPQREDARGQVDTALPDAEGQSSKPVGTEAER